MKVTYIITDTDLFSSKNIDVDTTDLKWKGTDQLNNDMGYYGNLAIDEEPDGWKTISGEFGANDYEEEYGFILKAE